jgi:type II secretory pathway pseudopilin PulG
MKRILTAILFLTLIAAVPVIAQDGQAVQEARQRAEIAARQAQQQAQRQAAGLAALQEAGEARADDATDQAFDRNGADAAVANQSDEAEDDAPLSPPAEELPDGTMRFHLMDGSILTGTLAVDALPVDTEFGRLVVPIDSIKSFAPGLNAHPQLAQQIDTLIAQLGSPNAAQRDRAQADLIAFGPDLIPELQKHADDPDDERKLRVATVLEELYSMMDDPMVFDQDPGPSLARLDHVVTDGFTIAGSIAVDTFVIESKFGQLTVGLGDIQSAGIVTNAVPDIRRTVEVTGTDMTRVSEKNTGIRLNRGDRVIIRAEGQITMTPWGNGAIATPDGCAQCGNYAGNILMGALIGRVGDNGSDMLIGSSSTFTAERAGTLYLSFALQPNWGRQQFPGKFTVRIRVVPAQ